MNEKQLTECKIQELIFEQSAKLKCSSPVFIRRYMNSSLAKRMDNQYALFESFGIDDAFEELEKEYGQSSYGKKKYSSEELYWIGFLYRYWNIKHGMSSKKIYQIANGENMRTVYFTYHSLDPEAAVERILEAKGMPVSDEEEHKRQLQIMRKAMIKAGTL